MNKKTIIGIIIAVIIIIADVVGYAMLSGNNESENTMQGGTNTENSTQVADSNTMESENLVNETTDEATNNTNTTENTTTDNQENVLIIYFSETGNTEKFANIIHDQIGGDMFKIEPVTPYPEGDELFDYTREERDENRRPEIQGTIENFEQYDTVFIGYPIWWYQMPMIMYTLFDNYDFSGKTIIPFNTHEGSGEGGTYEDIAELEPNATILAGLPIRGGNMQQDQTENIRTWLSELGF